MEVFRAYAFATSAYLTVQALPLLLAPRVVALLTSPEPRESTELESYLCRSLGVTFLAFALLIVLLTGAIPLKEDETFQLQQLISSGSPSISQLQLQHQHQQRFSDTASSIFSLENSYEDEEAKRLKSPYVQATLVVTTTYHACTAFYLYTKFVVAWSPALGGGCLLSSGLFSLGIWVLVFGGEKARFSRSTGADKKTSSVPLESKESAKETEKEKVREVEVKEKEKEKERDGKEKEREGKERERKEGKEREREGKEKDREGKEKDRKEGKDRSSRSKTLRTRSRVGF